MKETVAKPPSIEWRATPQKERKKEIEREKERATMFS